MAAPKLKMRLGDLLVHESIITDEQLVSALKEQRVSGRKLGATLIDLNLISEEQLLRFLAQQLNVPFLDISLRRIDPNMGDLLPEAHARRYRAIVLEDRGDSVLLGMSDPADLSSLDQLTPMFSPKDIDIAVVKESQILEAFDTLYRRTKEIASFAQQLQQEYEETSNFNFSGAADDSDGDAIVAQLLRTIFEDAVQVRASDIHIEPDESLLRIRQRVDGVLQENILPEVGIASALVLRLKLMAGLDISERRMPQDGRFNIKARNHDIDIRMSTIPTQNGEAVVMRLLDQSAGVLSLEQTGMPKAMLERFRALLRRPHGMILVTGPTGSGKTTTLYGALSELNQAEKKLITVEDPVEYRLPRINQIQVNPKIGLGFSEVLRTTLRHDPDILMIGEMRDKETAEIGLRGALTGHLVLSTLHTNDAVTSAMRLLDMGAPAYLVASSLRAVIAQRLVRRICDNCRKSATLEIQDILALSQLSGKAREEMQFYKGNGCQRCNYTGYRGRIGVFELLELNEAMVDALRLDNPQLFAEAARNEPSFQSFGLMAFGYAMEGITTAEEVLRVSEQQVG